MVGASLLYAILWPIMMVDASLLSARVMVETPVFTARKMVEAPLFTAREMTLLFIASYGKGSCFHCQRDGQCSFV